MYFVIFVLFSVNRNDMHTFMETCWQDVLNLILTWTDLLTLYETCLQDVVILTYTLNVLCKTSCLNSCSKHFDNFVTDSWLFWLIVFRLLFNDVALPLYAYRCPLTRWFMPPHLANCWETCMTNTLWLLDKNTGWTLLQSILSHCQSPHRWKCVCVCVCVFIESSLEYMGNRGSCVV